MIDGSNHMLNLDPTNYYEAMVAYKTANLVIAFRDADIRDLLREIEQRDKEIERLKKIAGID